MCDPPLYILYHGLINEFKLGLYYMTYAGHVPHVPIF